MYRMHLKLLLNVIVEVATWLQPEVVEEAVVSCGISEVLGAADTSSMLNNKYFTLMQKQNFKCICQAYTARTSSWLSYSNCCSIYNNLLSDCFQ